MKKKRARNDEPEAAQTRLDQEGDASACKSDETLAGSIEKKLSRSATSSSTSISKLVRSSVSSVSSVFRGARRTPIMSSSDNDKRWRRPPKRTTFSQGTQTSPGLEQLIKRSNRKHASTSKPQQACHPGSRVQTPKCSTPSVVRKLMSTSSLSPRVLSGMMDDYFYRAHHAKDDDEPSDSDHSNHSSGRSTPMQGGLPPLGSRPLDHVRKKNSAGAVEGHQRVGISSTEPVRLQSQRRTVSDSIIENKATSSVAENPSPLSGQIRAIPRFKRFQGPITRERARRPSPLFQELIRSRLKLSSGDSENGDSGSMFGALDAGNAHLQLYSHQASSGVATETPDHLPKSPLCPLHPKNKFYTLKSCPQHGELKTTESDRDNSSNVVTNTSSQMSLAESSDSSQEPSEPSKQSFNLNIQHHRPDTAACPASLRHHPDGRGVCVLHGRAQLQRSPESDESLAPTRAFVIGR